MSTAPTLDPLDLLEFAKQLAKRKDSPSIRTACDRAYYAAFLFARNQLTKLHKYTPQQSAQDHKGVDTQLQSETGGIEYGQSLRLLRVQRGYYTYDTGSPSVKPPAWMLSTAGNIIQFVQQLPP